jgi:hypothetical protein
MPQGSGMVEPLGLGVHGTLADLWIALATVRPEEAGRLAIILTQGFQCTSHAVVIHRVHRNLSEYIHAWE